MVNYKVFFKKSVAKDLRSIPNKEVARILEDDSPILYNANITGKIKRSEERT